MIIAAIITGVVIGFVIYRVTKIEKETEKLSKDLDDLLNEFE